MAEKDTASAVTLEYAELIQTTDQAENQLLRAYTLLSFMEAVDIPTNKIMRDGHCIYDEAVLSEVISYGQTNGWRGPD